MKAAVIQQLGDIPQYLDFPDPIQGKDDILIDVRAVVLENFDKLVVAGSHYASRRMFPAFPAIVGHSGVGTLADGTLVSFGGIQPPYGAMAEKAVVPHHAAKFVVPVPEGIDAAVAAALPASALTSFLPLKYGAKMQSGETVLINGATGVSGKLAVQIAALLGAGRIVCTGRDVQGLQAVQQLGADAVIDLKQTDEQIQETYRREARKGYDVVLDFLWGRPAELLLQTLVPQEAGFAVHRTRYVQIGASAGPAISLAAEMVRTSGLEMTGAGNVPPGVLPGAVGQVWTWIKEHELSMDIEQVPMKEIAAVWERKTEGKRLVIIP